MNHPARKAATGPKTAWQKKAHSQEENNAAKKVGAIAIKGFALLVVLGAAYQAMAQDATTPYPNMAPIERYLMDRDAEIALARSAAPDAISHDASVLVLTRHGYETAVEGKNGWVCWVGRGWMAMFDHPEFWSPKVRAADCLNPPAARSILPYAYKRTEMLLAGHSKQEVIAAIKSAIEKKELPALEQGAVSYMMSKSSYLTDNGDHNGPHLMFFQREKNDATWGANMTNAPVVSVNYWYLSAEAYPTAQELSSHGCVLGNGGQMVRWHPGPTHVALPNKIKRPHLKMGPPKKCRCRLQAVENWGQTERSPVYPAKKVRLCCRFFSLRDDYRMNHLVRRAILLA